MANKSLNKRSKTLDHFLQQKEGKSASKPLNQKKSRIGKEETDENEAKKQSGNYTSFSSKIFRENQYMEQFILEVKIDKFSFKCIKWKDERKHGKILKVKSLKVHILSGEHKNNTLKERSRNMKSLKTYLKRKQQEKRL